MSALRCAAGARCAGSVRCEGRQWQALGRRLRDQARHRL